MGKKSRSSFIARQEERLKEFEKAAAEGTPVIIASEEDHSEEITPLETQATEVIEHKTDDQKIETTEVSKADFDKLQASYDILKGKYDVENKNLLDTVRSQETLIKKLNEVVEALKTNKPDPGNKEGKKSSTSKINEELYGAYEEPIQDIVKLCNAQAEIIEGLQAELGALKNTTGNVSQKVDTFETEMSRRTSDAFMDRVRSKVADVDNINGDGDGRGADPRWIKYLNELDPYSKLRRRDIASSAVQRGDHDHFASMINDFKKVVNYQSENPKNKLESQIVPGPGGNGKPPVVSGIKPVSKEVYLKRAKDRQYGRITDEEWHKVELGYEQTLLQGAGG